MTIQELRKQRKEQQKNLNKQKRKVSKTLSDKKGQVVRENRRINKNIWGPQSKKSKLEQECVDIGLSVCGSKQLTFQKNGELSGVKFIQPNGFGPNLPPKELQAEWDDILAKEGL